MNAARGAASVDSRLLMRAYVVRILYGPTEGVEIMTQLVIWIVIATVYPTGARAAGDHGFHGQRLVAAYTTEVECQKRAHEANAGQQRVVKNARFCLRNIRL
jgi:hypothetical protein